MKTDITIQLKSLMLFMFMLFSSITQASADSISSISGPNPITKGQTVTVTIDCESADKDLIVALQKAIRPWTGFYGKRMHCNNNGKTTVTFTVPTTIPDGTPLMYQAYLTKKGKGWADRVAVKWQSSVSLGAVNTDKVIAIHGPNPIQKGQSITVNVDCRTTGNNELHFSLQKATNPWTGYYVQSTQCNNNGKTPISFTVPNNIPDGTALMYQGYIVQKGRGWADRVDVKWQSAIRLSSNSKENFILGVNIGSTNDVTIDEHTWLSENDAKKNGMQINSTHKLFSTTTDVTPAPAVDADMDTMLNSVRWASKDWNIKQPVGNGTYSVSVWIMENYRSHLRKINLSVEGQAKSAIGDLEKGQWKKYTYSNVKVTDDMLDIVLSGNSDVHMMGFEVLGQKPRDDDTTPPVLTLKGANPLKLKVGDKYKEPGATAKDDRDGDISAKIVISGDTVDTSTTGTYTVVYTVSDLAGNTATITRTVIVNLVGGDKPWDHGKLEVDGRMLKHADGTGFFWMGDTAWYMAYKLNREEVKTYLTNRKKHGFNVIQMQAISGKWHQRNRDGKKPFNNWDKTSEIKYNEPNEAYWKHIDFIIDEASKRGMYIALLPAWNGTYNNTGEAQIYGTFIANRYKNTKNIIWVNGGDSVPDDPRYPTHTNKSIWNAIGNAIDQVDGNRHLITFHAGSNESSVDWFKNQNWLDFNMLQTGHGAALKDANNRIGEGYVKDTRPILDGEPRYETIERNFYKYCLDPKTNTYVKNNVYNPPHDKVYRFNDKDVRQIAYMQLFAGAFGHTYGHHSIWSMSPKASLGDWNKKYGCHDSLYRTVNSWQEALNAPGAKQMKFVAKLMKSRPILNRVPDQSLISNGNAIATKGNGYAMVYLPTGGSVTVNLNKIASSVKAWWYNPINGNSTPIGTSQTATKTFTTGSNDMVLVLDDTSKGFAAPGQ